MKTWRQFTVKVWAACGKIPHGRVVTYGQLAAAIGQPRAVRAVGHALSQNPWAPHIPCHRVVRSDGSLGNYVGGPAQKQELLQKEGVYVKNNRIIDFSKKQANLQITVDYLEKKTKSLLRLAKSQKKQTKN